VSPGANRDKRPRLAARRNLISRRALILGGAGFIGSNLCHRLLAGGHEVVCVDNLSSGSRTSVAHLLDSEQFTLIEHDVCAPFEHECDEIYNLACPASPAFYSRDPIQTMRTSVLGAINALDLATRHGIPILQASTSEVYGDPLVHPQPEHYWGNVNPIGKRACYDEGKRAAEALFFDYQRTHQTAIRVARLFNTYGPGMAADDGRVVSNFIVQALRGEDLTIYGDGTQTRSFCFVDDTVDALLSLMATGLSGPVNIGNPAEVSVRDLALLIIDLTGSKARIVNREAPEDDPQRRRPDITLARDSLGWSPRISLREGLTRTISYFDRLLGSVSGAVAGSSGADAGVLARPS
jgi:UDP-glucuronate decarboxylase